MKLELIKIEDRLFELYRKMNKDKFKSPEKANDLKILWGCDEILENGEWLFFCKEVLEPEHEIININKNGEDAKHELTAEN
jgi:hypothetical protein